MLRDKFEFYKKINKENSRGLYIITIKSKLYGYKNQLKDQNLQKKFVIKCSYLCS